MWNCQALDSMTFPVAYLNSVSQIKARIKNLSLYGNAVITQGALDGYSALTNLVLGDDITAIEDYALRDLSSLSSVAVGKGVASIGSVVFFGSNKLSYITVSEENPIYYSVDNCLIERESGVLLYGAAKSVIPEDGSVTAIGPHAFYKNALSYPP